MNLILGSASLGRRKILAEAGYEFETMSADIDEKSMRHDDATELVMLLAHAKADALLPKITEPSLLITADQVVVCNGQIREKPQSPEEARAFLQSYGTHPAKTVSSVVVTNTQTRKRLEGLDLALVHFHPFPPPIIDDIIADGHLYRYAGGFTIDGLFAPFIRSIEGTRDSVIGLPMALTEKLLREAGNV